MKDPGEDRQLKTGMAGGLERAAMAFNRKIASRA
jgi:hypothetical protein